MDITIYSLSDPRTDAVRYVGKTIDPAKRPGTHLRAALHKRRHQKPRTHKDNWLLQLHDLGLEASFNVLEVVSEHDWIEAERQWIAQYDDLTNLATGGEGPHGMIRSVETRRKLSEARKKYTGWHHTDVTKTKIGDAHRGRIKGPNTPESNLKRSESMQGRSLTADHRAKISESNKNRTLSNLSRQRISDSLKKASDLPWPPDEALLEMANRMGWAEMERQIGIGQSAIRYRVKTLKERGW